MSYITLWSLFSWKYLHWTYKIDDLFIHIHTWTITTLSYKNMTWLILWVCCVSDAYEKIFVGRRQHVGTLTLSELTKIKHFSNRRDQNVAPVGTKVKTNCIYRTKVIFTPILSPPSSYFLSVSQNTPPVKTRQTQPEKEIEPCESDNEDKRNHSLHFQYVIVFICWNHSVGIYFHLVLFCFLVTLIHCLSESFSLFTLWLLPDNLNCLPLNCSYTHKDS